MFALLQDREMQLVFLFTLMTMAGFGLQLLIQWIGARTRGTEPWSEEIRTRLEGDDTQPLCHRCLEPHDASSYFCPHCGAPVGAIPTVSLA